MSADRPREVPKLLLLVGVLYLVAFPYHPGLRSPNELSRLWEARALVEYHVLDLNQALRDYGYVGDLAFKDGKYYLSKAPLLSFLAAPIYWGLRAASGGRRFSVPELAQVYWSRLLLTVLPTLYALWLVRKFLAAYVAAPLADAVTATYALGTLALSYSLLFMSHQTTAVLLFSAFFALWRVGRGEWRDRGAVLAGAAAGAAIAAEYTGALGLLGLVVFGAVQVLGGDGTRRERLVRLGRIAGLATLGALPFVAGLMAYHQACFGHPLHSGYKYLADVAYQPWHLGGFLGIRTPDPRAFALSLFSPLRGLFSLSPFLLVGVAGLPTVWRGGKPLRPAFWMCAVLLAGYGYFTSSFDYVSWGWTTGPRHLTPLVPFLLLPFALLVSKLRAGTRFGDRVGRGVAAGAAAVSVLVTGALSFVNYIPDSVSSALFSLVVPLYREGYLPPTLLAVLGVPNPGSGAALLAGLLAAAIWVAVVMLRPGSEEAAAPAPAARGRAELVQAVAVAVLTAGACLGLLAFAARDDAGDAGAKSLLESVWLAPTGRTIDLWPKQR